MAPNTVRTSDFDGHDLEDDGGRAGRSGWPQAGVLLRADAISLGVCPTSRVAVRVRWA